MFLDSQEVRSDEELCETDRETMSFVVDPVERDDMENLYNTIDYMDDDDHRRVFPG
jgi:hypothetical protein